MRLFIKAYPGYSEGTIRERKDGYRYQKMPGGRWVRLGKQTTAISALRNAEKRAGKDFDHAIEFSDGGMALYSILSDKYNITNFDDLQNFMQQSKSDTGKMYRDVIDSLRKAPISMGERMATMRLFSNAFRVLGNYFSKPKKKKTYQVTTKTGKVRWEYKKPKNKVSWKPSQLRSAKAMTAGWTSMSKLPTNEQIGRMIMNETADLTWGKIDRNKKWQVYQGLNDVVVPFKEGSKGITVKMRQYRTIKKRTKRTATIEVTIPYPYARDFIENQIKSTRTRNDLLGQLVRSKPYKEAVAVASKTKSESKAEEGIA